MATLVAGVFALSVADLVVTLAHLQSIGMMEANPVAAWVIRATNSPTALICFKLSTVGVCAAVLLAFRRRASAEIASWVAAGVMTFMSLHWYAYAESFTDPFELQLAGAGAYGDAWLMLE